MGPGTLLIRALGERRGGFGGHRKGLVLVVAGPWLLNQEIREGLDSLSLMAQSIKLTSP